MKKIIDKFKNFNPCKPLAILYILLIITISFFTLRIIDNDFWFLINQGRYIIENGFPTVEPFTIHYNSTMVNRCYILWYLSFIWSHRHNYLNFYSQCVNSIFII